MLSPSGDIQGELPRTPADGVMAQVLLRRASPNEIVSLCQGTWHKSVLSQPIAAADWLALEEMAHRTLVPASDSSRAGAGSTAGDND